MGLIGNVIILPCQFLENVHPVQPERRLLLALLTDAWNTLDRYTGMKGRRAQHLATEAWSWMEAGNVGTMPFDDTCEHLGINPDTFRKGVLKALEKKKDSVGVRRSAPRANIKVGSWRLRT